MDRFIFFGVIVLVIIIVVFVFLYFSKPKRKKLIEDTNQYATMSICPSCGKNIKKNWKSCPNCGINLDSEDYE